MTNTASIWLNFVCAMTAYFLGCYTTLTLVNRRLKKTLGSLNDLLQLLTHPVYMRPDAVASAYNEGLAAGAELVVKEHEYAKSTVGPGSGAEGKGRAVPAGAGSSQSAVADQSQAGTVERNSGGSGRGGGVMNAYPRGMSPMLAWEEAYNCRESQSVGWMRARTRYAVRRIGGLKYLEAKMDEFCQAYNEAPFEDSDQDTALQPDEQMKRMSDGGMQRVMK